MWKTGGMDRPVKGLGHLGAMQRYEKKDFPGDPGVKNLLKQCRGQWFRPWSGELGSYMPWGNQFPCVMTTQPSL